MICYLLKTTNVISFSYLHVFPQTIKCQKFFDHILGHVIYTKLKVSAFCFYPSDIKSDTEANLEASV